jgi:hypothetical protein
LLEGTGFEPLVPPDRCRAAHQSAASLRAREVDRVAAGFTSTSCG